MSTTLVARRLAATSLPRRMRTLARDSRGYPIPYLVMVDNSGTPQFTINDIRRQMHCVGKKLCAICGKRFDRSRLFLPEGRGDHLEMWFVGGLRSFLHERGAFLDPPLHLECAEYALRVCPFLAARRYGGRIDATKLDPDDMPDGMAVIRTDYVGAALPERFGLGLCFGYRIERSAGNPHGVYVVDDWRYIEWWQAGERVNAPDSGISPPYEEAA